MKLTRDQRTAIALRAEEALKDLRPFLEADGGDISLEEITPEGVARVRLHGACMGCSMSPMTMKAGVEEALKRAAPEIVSVEAVNMGVVA
jgi:Fe-S cluster biogenesis protein NfuA